MAKWTASGLSTLNAPDHRPAVGDAEAHDGWRPYERQAQGLSNLPTLEHVQEDPLQAKYNSFIDLSADEAPSVDMAAALRPYALKPQDTPPFGDCAFYAVLQKTRVTAALAAQIRQLRIDACALRTKEDPTYEPNEDETRMGIYVGVTLLKYVARVLGVDILQFNVDLATGKLQPRAIAMLKVAEANDRRPTRLRNEFPVDGQAAILQWLSAHPEARVILFVPSGRQTTYATDAQGQRQVRSDALRGHYYACVAL
jgi:hypothetical protein